MKGMVSPLLLTAFAVVMGLRLVELQFHDWSAPVPLDHMSFHTWLFVISCSLAFAICLYSALKLLGTRAALIFTGVGVSLGFFFEVTGVRYGWWFGKYSYSSLLGWKLAGVPIIVPLMWFSLVYIGYIISNLILWREPRQPSTIPFLVQSGFQRPIQQVLYSIPVAAVVLAYDLGADPYMVLIKAWSNPTGLWVLGLDGFTLERNTSYFHESVQGFRGWFFAALCIVVVFRFLVNELPVITASTLSRRQALWPVVIYASFCFYQWVLGRPPETQAFASVAMGIPTMFALGGWWWYRQTAGPGHDGGTT